MWKITIRNVIDGEEDRKRLNPDAEKLDREFDITEKEEKE